MCPIGGRQWRNQSKRDNPPLYIYPHRHTPHRIINRNKRERERRGKRFPCTHRQKAPRSIKKSGHYPQIPYRSFVLFSIQITKTLCVSHKKPFLPSFLPPSRHNLLPSVPARVCLADKMRIDPKRGLDDRRRRRRPSQPHKILFQDEIFVFTTFYLFLGRLKLLLFPPEMI